MSNSLRPHGLYIAHQAPPSMEFSRQEYWNGLPFPSPGDLPNPGIEPGSLALQADSLLSELPEKPKMALVMLERKKVKVKSLSHVRLFATHGLKPTRLLHPWNFLGKSTGVGCHFLLQEIFPTQGSNLGLPHCRQMLYHLSHQGSLYNIGVGLG